MSTIYRIKKANQTVHDFRAYEARSIGEACAMHDAFLQQEGQTDDSCQTYTVYWIDYIKPMNHALMHRLMTKTGTQGWEAVQ